MPTGPQGQKRPAETAAATDGIEEDLKVRSGKAGAQKLTADKRSALASRRHRDAGKPEGAAQEDRAQSLYMKAPNSYA